MKNFSEVCATLTAENLPEARLVVSDEVCHLRQMLTMLEKHEPGSIYAEQVTTCKKRISEREQWLLEHRISVLETELLRLSGEKSCALADVYAEVEAIYDAAKQ